MRRTSFERFGVAVLVAVSLSTVAANRVALAQPQHSAADLAQARELFNQGLKLRERGDEQGAFEKLKAAYVLAATPIIGLELGRSYLGLGKLVEARETFLSIARIPPRPEETAKSAAARTESAQLVERVRARIPTVTVRVTGMPADTVTLTIDDAAVPMAALDAPRLLDPGSHDILARSTRGGTAETRVDLKEGEARSVELTITLPPEAAPAPPPTSAPPAAVAAARPAGGPSPVLPMAYAGFGVAAVGLGVGGVTGALALSKASAVKGACDGTTCPRSVDGDLQTGRTLGDVSTVAFVVAGVGAIVGVTGVVLMRRQERAATSALSVSPWIGPASVGLRGWF